MTANVDAMVRAGAQEFRAGNREEARTLLERAIEIDEYNENAWLWLSAVVEDEQEQRTCLENVLIINPKNERARQGLRSLGYDPDAVGADKAAAAPAETADTPPQTPAFTDDSFDDYQVPSSSASVNRESETLSEEALDSWMENLDLGSASVEQSASNDPIDDAIFDEGEFEADFFSADFDDTGYDYEEESGNFANEMPATAAPDEYDFDEDEAMFDDEEMASTADDFALDQYDTYDTEEEVEVAPQSPEQAFDVIPDDIQPTRLPGEDEPAPTGDYAIIGVLVLANIAAIGFVISQFV